MIMAESSISLDANGIDADKIREITKYLVGILQKTEDDIDVLCEVVNFYDNSYSLQQLQSYFFWTRL